MSIKSGGTGSNGPITITISVLGVSGAERSKGAFGVGKSLLCNRFVRGGYDDFHTEHSSILSQTDFGGSPVINNDHWLYWGEGLVTTEDSLNNLQIRVIEQTEFVDDETFEPLEGASDDYSKRATRTKFESADKLMYICKEQLGLETEFEHRILPEGRVRVDGFIFVYDLSMVEGRPFDKQSDFGANVLINAIRTKKPVVIAASKTDIADEHGRKALQRLLARKELKSATLPTVEISSVLNVNVTTVFALIAALVEKSKMKPKLLGFADALKLQRKKEREISESYVSLLRELMPIEGWLHSRPTWAKLLNRVGLSRHTAYTQFVYIFGRGEARKLYQKHVNEAREYWMQRRLQTQTPRLAHVFADLIGTERVRCLTWPEAKEAICRHPLFDDYFLPLGTLGADLDPSSPQCEVNLSDSRIPAEILLTADAEPTFLEFQRIVDRDCRLERMEEQFEQALGQCAQVTPGKPLEEVDIFLRGNSAFDSLPSQLAHNIYAKFQEVLVKKAEGDFSELLLEQVQLFIDIVVKRRQITHTMRPLIGLEDTEMSELRSVLHEDARYRQLNRLFELRDKMISNYASFVSYPLVQNCPSGARCVDSLVQDIFHSHHKRQQAAESSQMLLIQLVVVGDARLVLDFTFAVSKLLHGDIMEHERGLARITCFTEAEADSDAKRSSTWVFLVDSADSLERHKESLSEAADFGCPPLVVLVVDPAHLDLLPTLHQQACSLATGILGIFVGPNSDPVTVSRRSSDNELNTFFTQDQMLRVLDAAFSSQIDGRRLDARVQLSLMCGDQFPVHCVLSSLLASAVHLTPSPSGGMATMEVPVPSWKRTARIDMRVSSYHSWLVSRAPVPVHGYILSYSARRRASFAHAATAAKSLISSSNAIANSVILFVAVAEVTDFFNDEETNMLLTEGSELADKLSAGFVTLSPEVAERLHAVTFLEFFERVLSAQRNSQSILPQSNDRSNHNGLGSAGEVLNQATSCSCDSGGCNTMLSEGTTGSRESTLSSLNASQPCRNVPSQQPEPLLKKVPSRTKTAPSAHSEQTVSSESAASFAVPRLLNLGVHAPSFSNATQPIAPLATPEHIEIANDYMTVKDAVGCKDDEEPYATLDFSSRYQGTPLHDVNRSSTQKSPIAERAKNLLPRFSRKHVTAPIPHPKPIQSVASASPPLSQPSTGVAGNKVSLDQIPALNRSAASAVPSAFLIRRLHSISAESLVDVGLINSSSLYGRINGGDSSSADSTSKKQIGNRFVRKVTSSFRFRKAMRRPITANKKSAEEIEDEIEGPGMTAVDDGGSRSVPHSPQMERANRPFPKGREPLSSNEKVSNAFSWLPSRSPRRNARSALPEGNARMIGVVSPSDTLQSLAAASKDNIPVFVKKCIEYIEEEGGLDVEGLYRVPGNQAQVGDLERAFLSNNEIRLRSLQLPVHVVATSLKNFFSGLPEPLIPYDLHDSLVNCVDGEQSGSLEKVREAMQAWPNANRKTMAYLAAHLSRVAKRADVNSMDFRNLAKVWWPTLFRPNFDSFESMAVFVTRLELATQLLVRHAAELQF